MDQYWVPDPEGVWTPCKVGKKGADSTDYVADDGKKITIKAKDVAGLEAVMADQLVMADDVCSMSVINEGAMLHTIRMRYGQQKIYTLVSRILISMNPFCGLPIYNKETMDKYSNGGDGAGLPPHIYGIGQDAMQGLRLGLRDQAILISGESGAGKTESAKLVLSYVAEVLKGKHGGIEERLLRTNPILEAFGNAMTNRNNNSSRFGKWLDINFANLKMSGCSLTSYLLEVSRVTFQAKGERGFHVFFQLLQARTSGKLGINTMKLEDPMTYRYLSGSQMTVPGIDDTKCFEEMKEAFTALKFPPEQQKEVWQILGGILNLGNCEFKDANEEAQLTDKAPVLKAAELLGVSDDTLSRCMTHKKITVGRDTMEKPIRADVAVQLRDSISRLIYGRLFLWLLERINTTLILDDAAAGKSKEGAQSLGVLDIAGFETFEINSLEQLLINLSNEHLQQQFNNTVFKTELEDYKKEGISLASTLAFTDNADVLELLDGKGSILDMLDEAVSMPKCTDLTYVGNCLKAHEKHPRMIKPKFPGKAVYGVKHFAGEVLYTCDGFIEKNADKPPDELTNVMQASTMPSLKALGEALAALAAGAAPGPGQKKKVKTAASAFRTSLRSLMSKIDAADPHYIRCVKPNMEKVPDKVTSALVYQQLLFSGVFDAISIRKQGYSSRTPFKEFAVRYMCILAVAVRKALPGKAGEKAHVQELVKNLAIPDGGCEVGSTKVLLKQTALNMLEKKREKSLHVPVVHMQKCWRRCKAKKRARERKAVSDELKAWLKKSSVYDDNIKKAATKNKKRLTVSAVSISAMSKLGSLEKLEKALTEVVPILEKAQKIHFQNVLVHEATKTQNRIKMEVEVANNVKSAASSLEPFLMDKALIRARELGLPEDDENIEKVKVRIAALQVQLPIINAMKGAITAEGADDAQLIAVMEGLAESGFKDKPENFLPELQAKALVEQMIAMWDARPELHNKKAAVDPTGARKTITGCGAIEQAKIMQALIEACESYDVDALEELLAGAINQGLAVADVEASKEVYESLNTESFLASAVEQAIEGAETEPHKSAAQLKNLAKQVRKLCGDTDLYKKAAKSAVKTGRKTMAGADGKALLESIFTDLASFEGLKEETVANKETLLSHTQECITEALCQVSPADEPKAVQSFRNIMIGMYDKPASDIEVMSARQAVMEVACSEPGLRNEIYVQSMRQITNNPSERSMLMGWQLLRFLCQASPPRPDLMEFVEAFASHALASGLTGVPDERFLKAAGVEESEWQAYTVDVSREAADCLAALQRPQSWILASAPGASTVGLNCKDDGMYDEQMQYDQYQQQMQYQQYQQQQQQYPNQQYPQGYSGGSQYQPLDVEGQPQGNQEEAGSCADKCCVVL